ncbi:MAG: hypothetical protein LBE13_09155 [Bacteroidales bacterium]|jgi:hypothetical protein|nr:hypothetical protein [Bacteroidales bacterium]
MTPYFYCLKQEFKLNWQDQLIRKLSGLVTIEILHEDINLDEYINKYIDYLRINFLSNSYLIGGYYTEYNEYNIKDMLILSIDDEKRNYSIKRFLQGLLISFFIRRKRIDSEYDILEKAILSMSSHIIYLGGELCEVKENSDNSFLIKPIREHSHYKGFTKNGTRINSLVR